MLAFEFIPLGWAIGTALGVLLILGFSAARDKAQVSDWDAQSEKEKELREVLTKRNEELRKHGYPTFDVEKEL